MLVYQRVNQDMIDYSHCHLKCPLVLSRRCSQIWPHDLAVVASLGRWFARQFTPSIIRRSWISILVGGVNPLKNISWSIGSIISNIWKTCSKPPTSYCFTVWWSAKIQSPKKWFLLRYPSGPQGHQLFVLWIESTTAWWFKPSVGIIIHRRFQPSMSSSIPR